MVQEQDIIGIVKELQDQWKGNNDCGPGSGMAVYKLRDNFPAIAQALLLAVEALEDIQEKADASMGETDGTDLGISLASIETESRHALSRIRSLGKDPVPCEHEVKKTNGTCLSCGKQIYIPSSAQ